MERIAAILVVFVLLMSGRPYEYKRPARVESLIVTADPVPLDRAGPERTQLGALRYLGGWALASNHPGFGGFSSLHMRADGRLALLSDTGEVVTLRPPETGRGRARLTADFRPLPFFPQESREPNWRWDSESHVVDPVTGRIWVGIELTRRICRYARDFVRVERCLAHPAVRQWPETTGMESLVRLPDGRFLAMAEEATGLFGGQDVLLFGGDPLTRAGQDVRHLGYLPPTGYVATDALLLGGGRMLVLNRRVSPFSLFTAALTLVDLGALRSGQMLSGPVVARLDGTVVHDNYEGLALSREGDDAVLWIVSDDNHLFFQRTLLLKFVLPRRWMDNSAVD